MLRVSALRFILDFDGKSIKLGAASADWTQLVGMSLSLPVIIDAWNAGYKVVWCFMIFFSRSIIIPSKYLVDLVEKFLQVYLILFTG